MILERAVREARRIRKNLVRLRGEIDLGGDCGLASLLLADALADVDTLRHTKDLYGRFCTPHVWNVVDGVIIDVTATQFNDSFESDDAGEPPVFGVLVTREPRIYHRPVTGRGRQTLAYLSEVDWYEDQDHRRLRTAMERLRNAVRAKRSPQLRPDDRCVVYKGKPLDRTTADKGRTDEARAFAVRLRRRKEAP